MPYITDAARLIQSIMSHPLNRTRKLAAASRFLRWQIATRLLPDGAIAVPFVNGSRLLATRRMAGALGNVYSGLQEFDDMAFLLHALRPGDVLADVGANVGSYSILAASVGARSIAFEPVPSTFASLADNVAINGYSGLIAARNLAVGARSGTVSMTCDLDAVNRVVGDNGIEGTMAVDIIPLDSVDELAGSSLFVKVDVEGYEREVVVGAKGILSSPTLRALVIELNASGAGNAQNSAEIHRSLRSLGLAGFRYDAFARTLEPIEGWNRESRNTLYIRDLPFIEDRIRRTPKVHINGVEF